MCHCGEEMIHSDILCFDCVLSKKVIVLPKGVNQSKMNIVVAVKIP